MGKGVVEVATKDNEEEKLEVAEVEVELPEYIVTMKILINTRDCVVL